MVLVNNLNINSNIFDNKNTIIEKYSKEIPGTLPSFFTIIKSNENNYILDYIVDDLKEFQDITELDIPLLKEKYKNIDPEDIIILFLKQKFLEFSGGDKSLENIFLNEKVKSEIIARNPYNILSYFYNNINSLYISFRKYDKNISLRREKFIKKLDNINDIQEKLSDVSPLKSEKTDYEKITLEYKLDTLETISFIDIFDSMDTSQIIPFIRYKDKGKNMYKVFTETFPKDSWIDKDCEIPGVFFKIFHPEINTYSDCEWIDTRTLHISKSNLLKLSDAQLLSLCLDSINQRINYSFLSVSQIGVKAIFTVDNFTLNKAIFLDMISNNDIFKFFLFVNEKCQDEYSYKTALTKDKLVVYYQPNQDYDIYNSYTITIIPKISDDSSFTWLNIRVSKADTERDVDNFKEVFLRLLNIYQQNYKDVLDEYRNLLPKADKLIKKFVKKPKVKKVDAKSGKRVKKLREQRPHIFRATYASNCQLKSHQPYLIESEKDAEEFKKKYGQGKILEYLDPITKKLDYYACQPREEDDENKNYIFPGLFQLKEGVKASEEYVNEVGYVPCCYTQNQYLKEGSTLYKFLKGIEEEEEYEIGKGYRLNPGKKLPPFRMGELQFYIQNTFKRFTDKTISRMGIYETPDSLLHCLELATNAIYYNGKKVDRLNIVRETRIKIANMNNFAVAKQELFGLTDDKIREMILNEPLIELEYWIRVLEKYYNCNIIGFEVNNSEPNGDFILPNHSQSYLYKKPNYDIPTIFLIKQCRKNKLPQYEICFFEDNNNFIFQFIDKFFVKDVYQLFESFLATFIFSNKGYILYKYPEEN